MYNVCITNFLAAPGVGNTYRLSLEVRNMDQIKVKAIRPTRVVINSEEEYKEFIAFARGQEQTEYMNKVRERFAAHQRVPKRSRAENIALQKHKDVEMKKAAIRAGGSLKTENKIDVQEICREVRGK